MEKIYGYKTKDVKGLADFINKRKGENLSALFDVYAKKTNKSKGTIRNMYYAIIKECKQNSNLANDCFNGKVPTISKIEEFTGDEERRLLEEVIIGVNNGKSVRNIVFQLAKGDAKLALRYQNKYRNLIKKNPPLVQDTIDKLKGMCPNGVENATEMVKKSISESQFTAVKNAINDLVDRLTQKALNENKVLRDKLAKLEIENLRLNNLLYSSPDKVNVKTWFIKNLRKDVQH